MFCDTVSDEWGVIRTYDLLFDVLCLYDFFMLFDLYFIQKWVFLNQMWTIVYKTFILFLKILR